MAIDISAAREAYSKRKIDRVGLVRGKDSLAFPLSKVGGKKVLETLLEKGMDTTPEQEWIFRTAADTHAKENSGSVDL